MIRRFDERNGWAGCVSCAEWLGWRTGLAPGAAREHVRVARALAELPRLSDAMRRGKVSYSKVRAITRVATPETEDDLLNVALSGTAAHVEKIVRAWRRVDRLAEQTEDRRRHETRSLRTWVDEDGMVVVRGRLSPEVGAVVRRALEAACDQARGEEAPGTERHAHADGAAGVVAASGKAAETSEPSLAQRQADALGVIAECALAGGLDRGTAGDRYQVVVHVDADALVEAPDVPAGTSTASAPGSRRRVDADDNRAGNGAARQRPARFRGNAGGGAPWHRPAGRGPGNTRGRDPTRRRRRADAQVGAPLSRGGRCGNRAGRPPADGAGRGGRHPRLGGDGQAAGLRRGHGQHATRPRGGDPRRRPPDPDHLAGSAPGVAGARPSMPVSGVPAPSRRRSPYRALGGRRPDRARQPGAALPPASPGGARGRVPRHPRCRRRRRVPSPRRPTASEGAAGPGVDGPAAGTVDRAAPARRHLDRPGHRHAGLARRTTRSGLGDPRPVAPAAAGGPDLRGTAARPAVTTTVRPFGAAYRTGGYDTDQTLCRVMLRSFTLAQDGAPVSRPLPQPVPTLHAVTLNGSWMTVPPGSSSRAKRPVRFDHRGDGLRRFLGRRGRDAP